eukprot:g19947.t2
MVNIMGRPEFRYPTGVRLDDDFYEAVGASDAVATEGDLNTASGLKQIPVDPSTCIFWCAVDLGALVKGNPIESVASYCRLASDALGTHPSTPTQDVAKAWAIRAYLHSFTGNTEKFQEYLDLSRSFLDASIEEGSFDTLPASIFVKACDKGAAAGGSTQDAESRDEGNSCRYLDGPLLADVCEAMAAGLQDLVVVGERLQEAIDRRPATGGLSW